MHILLINPNRYHHPPVIPLGIEYLAGSLSQTKHTFDILDLCFSENPEKEIELKIAVRKPDVIGISIRQVDTVLYHNNEYFIDEIKEYVSICKKQKCKVVLGGSGFSIMPHQILEFTGADYGITGPGEFSIIKMLDALENNKAIDKVTDGFLDLNNESYSFKRVKVTDYTNYLQNEGIVGFRTQIGCNENCIFCTEACKKIIYHQPSDVGMEIANWKEMGYNRFHLCDSEFNLNLNHCIKVCKAIKEYAGSTDWALYMKLRPYSDELFYLLEKSGAKMLTLSLDTSNTEKNDHEEIEQFLSLAKNYGIKVAIDLSTGFPYEKIDNLKIMLEFLDKCPVETIGINAFYRVYPNTGLYHLVKDNPQLKPFLIKYSEGADFLRPVFFNLFSLQTLKEVTGNNKKFRIEGFEKATNYQRVNK